MERILQAHHVPEMLFNWDIPRVKEGSKRQLSQEVLNTKSAPNSPSAVEGMTELQLTQVTRKQLVEIPLSVSMSNHSSPAEGTGGKSSLSINGMFVGQRWKRGWFNYQGRVTPKGFGGPSASPTLSASSYKKGKKITIIKASLPSQFFLCKFTSFWDILHDVHDCGLDFWKEENKEGMNSSQNPFSFIPVSKQPLNYWMTVQKTKTDVKKKTPRQHKETQADYSLSPV